MKLQEFYMFRRIKRASEPFTGITICLLISIFYFIIIKNTLIDNLIRFGYAHNIIMNIISVPVCIVFILFNVLIARMTKVRFKDFSRAYFVTSLITTIYIFLYSNYVGRAIMY